MGDMLSITLHLIFSLFLYNIFITVFFIGLKMGALEATAWAAVVTSPILCCFYAADQRKREIRPEIGFRFHGCLVWIVLFSLGLCYLGNYLVDALGLVRLSQAYKEASESLYSAPFPFQLLASGLIIPAAEELIFRGMVFAPIRDRLPFFPAAFLSALLFGLYHGNLPQGVYAFLLGLAAAWLYERCQTIAAAYFFHASANLFSICMTNIEWLGEAPERMNRLGKNLDLVVFGAAAVLGIIRISCKNKKKEELV